MASPPATRKRQSRRTPKSPSPQPATAKLSAQNENNKARKCNHEILREWNNNHQANQEEHYLTQQQQQQQSFQNDSLPASNNSKHKKWLDEADEIIDDFDKFNNYSPIDGVESLDSMERYVTRVSSNSSNIRHVESLDDDSIFEEHRNNGHHDMHQHLHHHQQQQQNQLEEEEQHEQEHRLQHQKRAVQEFKSNSVLSNNLKEIDSSILQILSMTQELLVGQTNDKNTTSINSTNKDVVDESSWEALIMAKRLVANSSVISSSNEDEDPYITNILNEYKGLQEWNNCGEKPNKQDQDQYPMNSRRQTCKMEGRAKERNSRLRQQHRRQIENPLKQSMPKNGSSSLQLSINNMMSGAGSVHADDVEKEDYNYPVPTTKAFVTSATNQPPGTSTTNRSRMKSKSTNVNKRSASCSRLLPPPPPPPRNQTNNNNNNNNKNNNNNAKKEGQSIQRGRGQSSHCVSDSKLLAMAKRLDEASITSDPDCIVGPDDPQYWKKIRGKSATQRQMRGNGNSVKRFNNSGEYLSEADNSRNGKSVKRFSNSGEYLSEAENSRHSRQSRKSTNTSRSKKKDRLAASARRKLHHERRKLTKLEAKTRQCELLAITNNNNGSSQSLGDGKKPSRRHAKQQLMMGSGVEFQTENRAQRQQKEQHPQHPQQQNVKISNRLLGKKNEYRSSTGTTNTNMTGFDSSMPSMYSSIASGMASDSRSLRSYGSSKSIRSWASSDSKKSSKSLASMKSNSSRKSSGSKFSLKLPFSRAKAMLLKQSSNPSHSQYSTPIPPQSKHRSHPRKSSNNCVYRQHTESLEFSNQNHIPPPLSPSHTCVNSRNDSNSSVCSGMTPTSSAAAALFEQQCTIPQGFEFQQYLPSATISFEDFSTCDSSISMYSSSSDFELDEGDEFDDYDNSSCDYSGEFDDGGIPRHKASVAQAVHYFNSQRKITKVATVASGLRRKICSKLPA